MTWRNTVSTFVVGIFDEGGRDAKSDKTAGV